MSQRQPDPWQTTTIDAQIEAIRMREEPPPPRRRRSLQIAGSASVLIVALGVLIVFLSSGGASANPTKSAAAAEKAETLTFTSTSILRAPGQPRQTAREEGAINLAQPAYRIRIFSDRTPIGFERRVFPRALYVRPLRLRGPSTWVAAELRPPAVIAPTAQGSNGLADTLGLLEVLRHVPSALIGHELSEGIHLAHYRAKTTLGRYLRSIGQPAPPGLTAAPVLIDVWIDPANRVHRAIRLFAIPNEKHAELEIRNRFGNYGRPIAIERPPGVPLVGSEPLDPVANDPLSADILRALAERSHKPTVTSVRPVP